MNPYLILYIRKYLCVSQSVTQLSRCTDRDEILHKDTLIFEDGYWLLFTAITDKHTGGTAEKANDKLKEKVKVRINFLLFIIVNIY